MKWLCLLVAMYVPNSRVILLEEPENFMHPWMQQRFISIVREQAKKLNISVIVSTHSVTILNSITLKELLLVYQTEGETHVESVKDQKEVQKVLDKTSFGLGDIWVSGGIGGVVGSTG
jgi:predicted ATPase